MKQNRLLQKAIGWTKKESIGVLAIFLAILTMVIVCGSIRSGMDHMVEKQTYHYQNARLLYVSGWEHSEMAYSGLDEAECSAILETVPYVEKVFPQSSRLFGTKVDIDRAGSADILLVGTDESMQWPVKAGRQMNWKAKEIMAPEVIVLESGEKIAGENLIGQELIFQYMEPYYSNAAMEIDLEKTKIHKESLMVVGVYETGEEYVLKNQFLSSFDEISALNQTTEGNWQQYQDPNRSLLILADHYDHLPEVEESLRQMGFDPRKIFVINWKAIHVVKLMALVMQAAVLMVGAALISLLQARGIDKHKGDIALMQAAGYTNGMMAKVLLMQTEAIAFIAFIAALLLGKVSYHYLDVLLFEEMGLPVFSVGFVLGHLALALLVPLIAMLFALRKLGKLSTVTILKEDD